jgi:hypothetical protein
LILILTFVFVFRLRLRLCDGVGSSLNLLLKSAVYLLPASCPLGVCSTRSLGTK